MTVELTTIIATSLAGLAALVSLRVAIAGSRTVRRVEMERFATEIESGLIPEYEKSQLKALSKHPETLPAQELKMLEEHLPLPLVYSLSDPVESSDLSGIAPDEEEIVTEEAS